MFVGFALIDDDILRHNDCVPEVRARDRDHTAFYSLCNYRFGLGSTFVY